MYEPKSRRPISHHHFLRRVAIHFAVAVGIIACSLLLGMAGYVYFEGLTWLDAYLNAAMLLGGMGPIHLPQTPGGKFFAGSYALYAGLVFIAVFALILTPVVHRLMHKFHWEEK